MSVGRRRRRRRKVYSKLTERKKRAIGGQTESCDSIGTILSWHDDVTHVYDDVTILSWHDTLLACPNSIGTMLSWHDALLEYAAPVSAAS